MSRTTLPDGSVRYAPNKGHRSARQPLRSRLLLAFSVLPLGATAFFRLGPAVGLPLVVGTAVLTILAMMVWRLTLPRFYTITKSADAITLRNYGRTSTVTRNENLRGDARLLVHSYGLTQVYVVLSGDDGRFKINADVLTEDDMEDLVRGIPTGPAPAGPVSIKEFDREFPKLLPFGIRRPNVTAASIVVGIVVAVLIAYFVFFEPESSSGPDDVPEPSLTELNLSRAAAAEQNQLQDRAARLVSPGPDWRTGDPYVENCFGGGFQRILAIGGTTTRPYTEDDRTALTELATSAGMSEVDVSTEGGSITRLLFQNEKTGAELELSVEETYTGLSTGSACADPK